LCDKLKLVLGNHNFSWEKPSENEITFTREECKYEIKFEGGVVKLSFGERVLCEWLLGRSKKDAEMAIADFSEAILGRKEKGKILKKPSLTNVDFFFLAEKFCGIFPEIKQNFEHEKLEFGKKFRKIRFTRESIVPKIYDLLSKEKEKNKLEKIFKILSNAYVFGDEDTKCIVTMAIFNEIKSAQERELAKQFLPNSIKKVWNASARYAV
jgi:hypothetical protein